MVSHKYKCIFIHLPKTGGEAISSLFKDFDPQIPKHANAMQIRNYLGQEIWDEYYKFTIVRNPFDQVLSMYSHLRKSLYQKDILKEKYGKTIINPVNACNTALESSFPLYCKTVLKGSQYQKETDRKEWPVNHFAPFIEWISDDNGKIIVDYIGKFENLSEEIDYIFKKLDRPLIQVPKKNRSKHKHYSLYYNQSAIDIVSNHYKKDFEYFKYTFHDERKKIHQILNLFK